MSKLTQKELKKLLHYDPQTGVFTKHKTVDKRNHQRGGFEVGCLSPDGYCLICISYKSYKRSILAWLYIYGYFPKKIIDHKNKNRHDDRINNLRETTKQQNAWNSRLSKNNTSGVKGVYWSKTHKKWVARIKFNYKNCSLGYYKHFENAVYARIAGEQCLGVDFWNGNLSSVKYLKRDTSK